MVQGRVAPLCTHTLSEITNKEFKDRHPNLGLKQAQLQDPLHKFKIKG